MLANVDIVRCLQDVCKIAYVLAVQNVLAVPTLTNSDMPMPAFKMFLLLSIHFSSSTRLLQPAHHQIPPPYLSPFPLSSTMRLLFFAALLGLLNTSLAHNIQMGAHQRECFHEALHKDDKMTVSFQVGDREFGGAGNLEIDFWVGAPCRVLRAKRKMRYPGQRHTRAFRSSMDSPDSYC